MPLDIQHIWFQFFGGLGLFLYAIKVMGDGIKKTAGDKLRDILDHFTSNPVLGVLVGVFVTVLIQSSSATTVITVGLVSAGYMTLRQAVGIIMGANIGTTITAFIIGINIGEFSLPIMAIGAISFFFFKNKRANTVGQIVFGFGALFLGLEIMGSGMKPLRNLEIFHDFSLNLSSTPIVGVILGIFFTVIFQSSSATIGVLQELHADQLVSLHAALPVLLGENIGTTITAVLTAIGTTLVAKRAAAIHVLFNLLGTIFFLLLLKPFIFSMEFLQEELTLNPKMTIAFAHGIFNITNTIIQLPLMGLLITIVSKLIPGKEAEYVQKGIFLNPLFIDQSPSIALGQAKEGVLKMGKYALDGLQESNRFIHTKNRSHSENAFQIEEIINAMDRNITEYLVSLSTRSLTEHESEEHSSLLDSIRDIERIGDHVENIIELSEYQKANNVDISKSALLDLQELFALTISTLKASLEALDHKDKTIAQSVLTKEEEIDKMERMLRKKHILRINEGNCTGQAGIVFIDIISNLERIGDHAVNIAESVLGEHPY